MHRTGYMLTRIFGCECRGLVGFFLRAITSCAAVPIRCVRKGLGVLGCLGLAHLFLLTGVSVGILGCSY